MNGFLALLGCLKGTLAVQFRYLPRFLVSPFVGAVKAMWDEFDRCDAEIAAFKARYIEDLEKSTGR